MTENFRNESFHADRPITSCNEDVLGRKNFAWAIADRIVAWSERDSLVIALYGDWGAGKSSVKNMILERLKNENVKTKGGPIVMEFNPWQFSGSDQLCNQFFEALAEILAGEISSPKSKKGITNEGVERLRSYGKYLSWGSALAKGAAIVSTAFVGPVGAAIGLSAAEGMEAASKAAETGAAASEKSIPSLAEIKRLLHDDFQGMKRKVLVVIDDIDRLASDEICLLFRIIRANADLPNLQFLLLTQRDSAEKALDIISNQHGSQFLEKIVQVPFDLPQPATGSVHEMVMRGMEPIVGPILTQRKRDYKRWPDLWHGGLKEYFNNLREAHRYLNALKFSSTVFKGTEAFEINALDLIALEVLRVFEPKVFELLPVYKSTLLQRNDTRDSKDDLEAALGVFEKNAKKPEAIRAILALIFPPLQRVTRNVTYSSSEWGKAWKRERRVADESFFDRYMQLGIPHGQVTESEIQILIKKSGNYAAVRKILAAWKRQGCFEAALERIEAEDSLKKLSNPVPFLAAALDESEDLGAIRLHLARYNLTYYATNWAVHYVRAAPDASARDAMAVGIIKATKGVYATMELVLDLIRKPSDREPEQREPFLTGQAAKVVKDEALARVQKLVRAQKLISHPKFTDIFWRWYYLAEGDAKKWVKSQLGEFRRAILLIKAFSSESTTNPLGSHYVGQYLWLSLKNLEEMAPLEEWKKALRLPGKTRLSKSQKIYLDLFQRALSRREKGLPDNDWRTVQDLQNDDND